MGLFSDIAELFGQFDVLGAFWMNIKLTFWAAVIALSVGTILAVMREIGRAHV